MEIFSIRRNTRTANKTSESVSINYARQEVSWDEISLFSLPSRCAATTGCVYDIKCFVDVKPSIIGWRHTVQWWLHNQTRWLVFNSSENPQVHGAINLSGATCNYIASNMWRPFSLWVARKKLKCRARKRGEERMKRNSEQKAGKKSMKKRFLAEPRRPCDGATAHIRLEKASIGVWNRFYGSSMMANSRLHNEFQHHEEFLLSMEQLRLNRWWITSKS